MFAEFYGVSAEDEDVCYVLFWGDCCGVMSLNDDCGVFGGVYGFGEFFAHFFFVYYLGFSLFVFACD